MKRMTGLATGWIFAVGALLSAQESGQDPVALIRHAARGLAEFNYTFSTRAEVDTAESSVRRFPKAFPRDVKGFVDREIGVHHLRIRLELMSPDTIHIDSAPTLTARLLRYPTVRATEAKATHEMPVVFLELVRQTSSPALAAVSGLAPMLHLERRVASLQASVEQLVHENRSLRKMINDRLDGLSRVVAATSETPPVPEAAPAQAPVSNPLPVRPRAPTLEPFPIVSPPPLAQPALVTLPAWQPEPQTEPYLVLELRADDGPPLRIVPARFSPPLPRRTLSARAPYDVLTPDYEPLPPRPTQLARSIWNPWPRLLPVPGKH